jgi:hypothetical protein
MRPDDFHDNRQTQTRSVATNAFPTPEALEDPLPILG